MNKTITIEDEETAFIVMNAIAKQAKNFDTYIEIYDNSPNVIKKKWRIASDKLWAVVRQFDGSK